MKLFARTLAASVALALALVMTGCTQRRPSPEPTQTPSRSAGPVLSPSRSAETGLPWTPATHLHARRGFMGDAQRPVLIDGVWHFYYLWNGDWPDGNGTEWRHATSTDLVHWTDRGVAIEKYRNGLGDIETGSAVVDTRNTAGFGKNAIVAIVTQRTEGIQRQSLFYSTDGGNHFTGYEGNPVMDNPTGDAEFRDPKVVWDDARGQWVMALAEDDKIGFYTSPDLKAWHYESGFVRHDLGTLECPDLFQLDVDGDPARRTWVLGVGANGYEYGRSTGYAYWTGDFDGHGFTPHDPAPQWLDGGADFYAAVTFTDRSAGTETQYDHRYAIGWMGNWDYNTELPTRDRSGQMTVTREIRLRTVDGRPRLTQQPVSRTTAAYPEVRYTAAALGPEGRTVRLPARAGGTTQLVDATLVPDGSATGITVRASRDGRQGTRVWYDPAAGDLVVSRERSGVIPSAAFRGEQRVPVALTDGRLTVRIFVDRSSVEVFAGDGRATITDAVFPDASSTGVAVDSAGAGRVEGLTVRTPGA